MYRVIVDAFREPYDGGHIYRRGDVFPREGYNPGKARIRYLLGRTKGFGAPVIEAVEAEAQEEKTEE